MRSSHTLDRIATTFDDRHLIADAGLLLPATLAEHLGLESLFDQNVDLGSARGHAHVGAKALTLIMSALAGGDCIDDADALRAGGTAAVLGHELRAPSTLGTFLRSFSWAHARQLDVVSRELLRRAWAAGAGPASGDLTIDLDSTICETYGLQKEGGKRFTYTHVRGYHPLLAVAAGLGEVLHCRLRGGSAQSIRGAASFLRETLARARDAGASGALVVRADSGFYSGAVTRACRTAGARFSITVKLYAGLRGRIEALPEEAWTAIPYWQEGGADVAELPFTPFAHERDATEVRLIVRRVRPSPGSQLALFTPYAYHALITDREGQMLALEADHRRHAEVENTVRDLKYGVGLNHLPSGRFGANAAWLALQTMAHNIARWTSRIGLGEALIATKTLRRRFLALPARLARSARRLWLHLPKQWPWADRFASALAVLRAISLPLTT
ncbi:MAG: IS1380 family transposase [Thermoleophilaceae bacterium]